MRVYKSKWFHKWANHGGISDRSLLKAIEEMNNGLIDAHLGNHVYKKRIGVEGRGKRGGVRTFLAFKHEDLAFFIYRVCQ